MNRHVGGNAMKTRSKEENIILCFNRDITLWMCFMTVFALSLVVLMPEPSPAHGFAGKRFFPTTFAVEDPFVSDEFSLLVNHIKEPAEEEVPPVKTTDLSLEYSKRITQKLGISIGETYRFLNYNHNGSEDGFGNLEAGAKYQFLTSETHEAIISVGVGSELGGTGAARVGAESFSVISPALYLGKGFGDLPDSMKYFRPFAITGVIGPNYPTRKENVISVDEDTGEEEIELNPDTLTWAFTLQYSLMYLQSFVKDVGIGGPFKRMVVLVEFPMETCLNRGCDGEITGTVNPGIVWVGTYAQLGIAAEIPVNTRTGKTIGVFGLAHFFIDDLFPGSAGKPIFP